MGKLFLDLLKGVLLAIAGILLIIVGRIIMFFEPKKDNH